ncbi:zinc ribbon domain-containing protein [Sinimarinibacterium flocculans]|uniref:zinc ribbon domain-containing protein n=1 Tax=Sinimarinibacterium flocculans TaxID=985250 RepID=UPI00344C9C1C
MPEAPKKQLLELRVSCSNCEKTPDKEQEHCKHCGERLTREWIKKETGNPYDQ